MIVRSWRNPIVVGISTVVTCFVLAACAMSGEVGDGTLVPPTGVTIEAGRGVSIRFQSGAFDAPRRVSVRLIRSAISSTPLVIARDFLGFEPVLDLVAIVDTGSVFPRNDVIAEIALPADIREGVAADHGVYLLALARKSDELGTLETYEAIPSEYDSASGTVRAMIGQAYFTAEPVEGLGTGGSFRAVLSVVSMPGANLARAETDGGASALQVVADESDAVCKGQYMPCPLPGNGCDASQYRSSFGPRLHPRHGKVLPHTGIDLAAAIGTPIYAPSDGVIWRAYTQRDAAGNEAGYGKVVMLQHSGGSGMTLYAHLSDNTVVAPGATVEKGDLIGYTGNSGVGTGPHLHFEYAPNGKIFGKDSGRVNPAACIGEAPEDASVLVRDNGSLADDSFLVILEEIELGETEIGGSGRFGLGRLRPGTLSLVVRGVVVPDGEGTVEITLNEGIVFDDNTTRKSAVLAQSEDAAFTIIVPAGSLD